MFGVFVAYVKLGDVVQIGLENGIFALLALTFVIIWADSGLDHQAVWDRLDQGDTTEGAVDSAAPIHTCRLARSAAKPAAWSASLGPTIRAALAATLSCTRASRTACPGPGRW